MKAAIIRAAGDKPIYGDFAEPLVSDRTEIVTVTASALSQFSKSRSSGRHYSSDAEFPAIAGADGVGITCRWKAGLFLLRWRLTGGWRRRHRSAQQLTVPVPDELDDVTAAAIANPGYVCMGSTR